MHIKGVKYSSHFLKAFKKLSTDLQHLAIAREKLLREDCFNPILKTHKLTGKLDGMWAFSINYSYRVLFVFENDGYLGFIDIGSHRIYR